jgi:hypothetical protein
MYPSLADRTPDCMAKKQATGTLVVSCWLLVAAGGFKSDSVARSIFPNAANRKASGGREALVSAPISRPFVPHASGNPLVPSCCRAGGASDASRRGRRQALAPGPRSQPRRLRLTALCQAPVCAHTIPVSPSPRPGTGRRARPGLVMKATQTPPLPLVSQPIVGVGYSPAGRLLA